MRLPGDVREELEHLSKGLRTVRKAGASSTSRLGSGCAGKEMRRREPRYARSRSVRNAAVQETAVQRTHFIQHTTRHSTAVRSTEWVGGFGRLKSTTWRWWTEQRQLEPTDQLV